jgi:uncharacterized protein YjiS (DUF1127 family)
LPSSFEIERQAHIRRSRAVHAFMRGAARAGAEWLGAITSRILQVGNALAAAARRRSAVRELQRFDDRTLADIGLTRGEIEFMVRYGWSMPPSHRISAPARPWPSRARPAAPAPIQPHLQEGTCS